MRPRWWDIQEKTGLFFVSLVFGRAVLGLEQGTIPKFIHHLSADASEEVDFPLCLRAPKLKYQFSNPAHEKDAD
jgi:hypothetical protein